MPSDRHSLPSDLDLKKALYGERDLLGKVQVPILTISATFRKELADEYKTLYHTAADVVFSRAHYSMAKAVMQAAEEMKLTTHLSDPTNFVSDKGWDKVEFTETIGQLMARYKLLKELKDKIDTVVRDKLPIAEPISRPLEYLVENIKCPVLSLHYEVGNEVVKLNKRVIQVITDPHVRPQYLYTLPTDRITYCVFDEETKKMVFEEAKKQGKEIKPEQVVVTGPPVDPRISRMGLKHKQFPKKGEPLRLGVCTGGLGTNLKEIKEVLKQLAPMLKPPEKIRLFLYAGTHRDFRNFFEDYAADEHVRIGDLDDEQARIRILYEDSIIDANRNLIEHMFPWADGVITKPSGDMAYDAAAAGCFMLFLEPWGKWEENIQQRFVKRGVGFDLKVWGSYAQVRDLWRKDGLKIAMSKAYKLPRLFREEASNIVKVQQRFGCER